MMPELDLTANPNTLWASIFVDHLVHAGLRMACIAPGSRSTPLTLAFAQHPDVRIYIHLDERSAGFFALGLAMASVEGQSRPVALVCTSGTAAANFHPAVIEAYYAHIPLLILTADRPPELRESGANQTIDQIKMFGDHVLWSADAPVPQSDSPEVVVRHMQTLASRAYALANGLVKGPVHINFPFRKPLEPSKQEKGTKSIAENLPEPRQILYTRISYGTLKPTNDQIEEIGQLILQNRHGFIICGPDPYAASYAKDVTRLAQATGYPIMADPLSNLRTAEDESGALVLGGYHAWLPAIRHQMPEADVIIRFGAVPTSASLSSYLDSINPTVHVHIREDGRWADDLHRTSELIQSNPAEFCDALVSYLSSTHFQVDDKWPNPVKRAESVVWETLAGEIENEPFFDGAAVYQLLASLPENTILFGGNSLPIRHLDSYYQPIRKTVTLYGNRGASGIDGNVSTALGIAATTDRPVVALLGDITFYHDMNGLLAARRHNLHNVTFIILNNNGGGIFHRLPVAQFDPPFTDLFLTPHGLTFEYAAALFGLDYRLANDKRSFAEVLEWTFANPSGRTVAKVVEVQTDSRADFRIQLAIKRTIESKLLEHQYK